jgi:hypothetical protein
MLTILAFMAIMAVILVIASLLAMWHDRISWKQKYEGLLVQGMKEAASHQRLQAKYDDLSEEKSEHDCVRKRMSQSEPNGD